MRNLLHKSKLLEFRNWLKLRDWQMQEIKGDYEVLRAVHINYKEPCIVYTQADPKEHLTVFGISQRLAWEFVKEKQAEESRA